MAKRKKKKHIRAKKHAQGRHSSGVGKKKRLHRERVSVSAGTGAGAGAHADVGASVGAGVDVASRPQPLDSPLVQEIGPQHIAQAPSEQRPAHINPSSTSSLAPPTARILRLVFVGLLVVGLGISLAHIGRNGGFTSVLGTADGSASTQSEPVDTARGSSAADTVANTAAKDTPTNTENNSTGADSTTGEAAGSELILMEELDSLHQPHVKGTLAAGAKGELAYSGRKSFESSDALDNLRTTIASIEGEGYTVGIAFSDIEGDVSLYYNPAERVYSASAIKGPYVLFAGEKLIDTGQVREMRRTITSCIIQSDNDAYATIRRSSYHMGWLDYLIEAGLDTSGRESDFDDHTYTDMCAHDFELLWRRGYSYLSANEGAAKWLAPLYEDTKSSSLHAVLCGPYKVWSKAGWYEESQAQSKYTREASATNDAGIVFSETGPYVLAIVSDMPVDFARLCELVDAANMCHEELSGIEVAPLLNEETPIPVY